MSATAPARQWIQIDMADSSLAGVTVRPEDGDLFSLSRQMITRLGRIAQQIDEFERQLANLRRDLEKWVAARAGSIAKAFLVLKGDHFLFLVALKGKRHDDALEDALTDLDMAVAQNPDYDLISLSVLALPAFAEDTIQSFLSPRAEPNSEGDDAE